RRGTGGAVRQALPLLGQDFFVTYGDSLLEFDPYAMWRQYCRSGAVAMMAVLHNRDRWDRSNVVFDGEMVLCHEKSIQDRVGREWIDWGISIFTAEIIRKWPTPDPFDLASVTNHLAANGQLAGFEVARRFYEIGKPDGLAETESYLLLQKDIA